MSTIKNKGDYYRSLSNKQIAELLSSIVSSLDCPKEVWNKLQECDSYKDAWEYYLNLPLKQDIEDEEVILRDCHKCVYEVGCHGNPVNCKSYKRDPPDGGYYG